MLHRFLWQFPAILKFVICQTVFQLAVECRCWETATKHWWSLYNRIDKMSEKSNAYHRPPHLMAELWWEIPDSCPLVDAKWHKPCGQAHPNLIDLYLCHHTTKNCPWTACGTRHTVFKGPRSKFERATRLLLEELQSAECSFQGFCKNSAALINTI